MQKKKGLQISFKFAKNINGSKTTKLDFTNKMKNQYFIIMLAQIMIVINCWSQNKLFETKTKPMDINIEMRKEFEEIINYFKSKNEMHAVTEANVRSFIDYLLEQTAYTKKRLSEIIVDLNYETIRRDEEYKVWPNIEFCRGVDDYESRAMLRYDDGVADIDNQESIVKGQYDFYTIQPDSVRLKEAKERQAIKIDINKYPISHLGFHEYRFNETALFYSWIAYIWQEIEGHNCGIKVKTVQSNSNATFSLNDFLDGDFSEYMEAADKEKPERLKNPFPRKLTLIELFQRASQSSYPFNPFNTYWRYFEKVGQFKEIGTYEFKTGIRKGTLSERQNGDLDSIVKHKDSKQALLYIRDFTNQMIIEGWQEKLRPIDMPLMFDENAFQFEYWTGIHWTEDQSAKLTAENVIQLENLLGLKLPKAYFHYLRIFNGRQHNSHNMYFPINDLYTIHVDKFYTLEELPEYNDKNNVHKTGNLIIGESVDGTKIGIKIRSGSKSYNKITMIINDEIVECDYSFELFAKYAQHSPKQPEIYAAEQNDAAFLSKRLSEGWDFNTSYQYQDALNQAAEHNSYDALEVLLKAGARLKFKSYREHRQDTYDETTMKILDEYQKD